MIAAYIEEKEICSHAVVCVRPPSYRVQWKGAHKNYHVWLQVCMSGYISHHRYWQECGRGGGIPLETESTFILKLEALALMYTG